MKGAKKCKAQENWVTSVIIQRPDLDSFEDLTSESCLDVQQDAASLQIKKSVEIS